MSVTSLLLVNSQGIEGVQSLSETVPNTLIVSAIFSVNLHAVQCIGDVRYCCKSSDVTHLRDAEDGVLLRIFARRPGETGMS